MQTGTRAISLAAVFLGTVCLVAAQPQVAIGDYLANLGYPNQITVGPDGALWYTSPQANSIGRMTIAGTNPKVYPIPAAYSEVTAIVAGPDLALWFVEPGGNKIGRISLAGAITEYEIPTTNSSPGGIVRAPDGKLWFTETAAKKIGSTSTGGQIIEYPVNSSGGPASMTIGADGALWFTETVANAIGQLTSLGTFHEYQVPLLGGNPSSLGAITSGPDGALWFTESNQGVIGRITTSGLVTQYSIPVFQAQPSGITTGPDGALWFGLYTSQLIGRVTTDGVFASYPVPGTVPAYTWGPAPAAIVSGLDGSLWFTENLSGTIGQVVFPSATLTVNLSAATCLSSIAFSGSNFAPGEQVLIYSHGFGSATLAEAVADSTGSFTVNSLVPPTNAGQRLFLAQGVQSKRRGAASFVENPRLVLSQQSGPPGSTVTATGCGYFPSARFNVKWNASSVSVLLGSTDTDSAGNISGANAFRFTVPPETPPGSYVVEALGADLGEVEIAVALFTVN